MYQKYFLEKLPNIGSFK